MHTTIGTIATELWRDLTDPRNAVSAEELEAGRKEPVFENLEIPEHFGPVHILVDEHKIKRFAFVQDDYGPWHLTGSPFGGRIGQAALLGNDLLQLFTTKYSASKTVGFHTEEQMWFDNPVRLGECVRLSGTYVESYVRRGQGYVVMEAQAFGEDGRSLIRHRGIEILRTIPGQIAGRGSDTPQRRVSGEVPVETRSVDYFGPDTRTGDVLRSAERTITFEQAAVFSRMGEFVRNIHNDFGVARGAELRLPIVQGQQQAGCFAQLLTQGFGRTWFTNGWLQVKFVAPLEVFEPFKITALVTNISNDDGRRRADLEIWIRRLSDERMTAVGWASCLLPDA